MHPALSPKNSHNPDLVWIRIYVPNVVRNFLAPLQISYDLTDKTTTGPKKLKNVVHILQKNKFGISPS